VWTHFIQIKVQTRASIEAKLAVCFLAVQGNSLEPLDFSEQLLDARSPPVEGLRKMSLGIFRIFPLRNDGNDTSVARRLAVCVAVIPLVGHNSARHGTQRGIKQQLEERRVVLLAASEQKGQRQAPMIALQMDFRGKPAT